MSRPSRSLVALALLGCSDPYPLPPTRCDDFCHATQRGDCANDDPANCVANCEYDGVLNRAPACAEAWDARNACYLEAAEDRFHCVDDTSTPESNLCLEEQQRLFTCASPGATSCLEHCARTELGCGRDPATCYSTCEGQGTECRGEEEAYYACALAAPVQCEATDPETPADQIPCFTEILTWFDCLGWKGDDTQQQQVE